MYSEISANKRKTVYIMALFSGFVAGVAWLVSLYLGDTSFLPFVLGGSLIYVLISYYSAGKLAVAMNGAVAIEKKDNPRLWRTVENLVISEGMPMPKVYIINDPAPNAFATGRNPNHAIVCATTGLLEMMDDKELQGVMAHELGHVKNYDIRVSMIAFAMVAVVGILADMLWRISWFRDSDDDNNSPIVMVLGLLAIILAPLIAALIQAAISRKREYLADATGALTTRFPEGLASALEKIGARGSAMRRQNTSTAHLFFANPLKGKSIASLFSTHPPIDERVNRLRKMGHHA
ncbi:MAG: M48 family metalloprotease [Patescibacteria group bacterium]